MPGWRPFLVASSLSERANKGNFVHAPSGPPTRILGGGIAKKSVFILKIRVQFFLSDRLLGA
jgi:hypothetical protein